MKELSIPLSSNLEVTTYIRIHSYSCSTPCSLFATIFGKSSTIYIYLYFVSVQTTTVLPYSSTLQLHLQYTLQYSVVLLEVGQLYSQLQIEVLEPRAPPTRRGLCTMPCTLFTHACGVVPPHLRPRMHPAAHSVVLGAFSSVALGALGTHAGRLGRYPQCRAGAASPCVRPSTRLSPRRNRGPESADRWVA